MNSADSNKAKMLSLSKRKTEKYTPSHKYDFSGFEDDILGLDRSFNEVYVKKDFLADVAGKIRRLRKENRLTQQELGDRVGVQKAQISRLESSTANMTIDTLQKILLALGASLDIIKLKY
jgi:HTH-type transcriptional regulator/antitoxin HipB